MRESSTGIGYFRDIFFEIESETGILTDRIDGIRYWERIRFQVFRELLRKTGVQDQSHSSKGKNVQELLHGLWLWGSNFVHRSPFFADPADLLVFGHPRRKQRADGYWWDLYCDPLLAEMGSGYQYVEYDYQLQHYQPPKTENIRYVDAIQYSGTIAKKVAPLRYSVDNSTITQFEDRIHTETGVRLDIENKVEDTLTGRRVQLPLYERLLERVSPSLALLVVSYGKETFIEACRRKSVPVAELQHGILSPYHLGYHYPDNQSKEMFPDYFFSFGEFWSSAASLPLPDENIMPVGYPYFESEKQEVASVEKQGTVLFISQGTEGAELSTIAVELAQQSDREVVYKLHPGEYDRWQEIYPELKTSEVEVVGEEGRPLYELFAEADAQVGINSTALYEGLSFGLQTFLLSTQGVKIAGPLIETGYPHVFDTASELEELLKSTTNEMGNVSELFKPNSLENMRQLVKDMIENDSFDDC